MQNKNLLAAHIITEGILGNLSHFETHEVKLIMFTIVKPINVF